MTETKRVASLTLRLDMLENLFQATQYDSIQDGSPLANKLAMFLGNTALFGYLILSHCI